MFPQNNVAKSAVLASSVSRLRALKEYLSSEFGWKYWYKYSELPPKCCSKMNIILEVHKRWSVAKPVVAFGVRDDGTWFFVQYSTDTLSRYKGPYAKGSGFLKEQYNVRVERVMGRFL